MTTAANRANIALPNSVNNNHRTRPPVSRPLHSYRGSQTSYNNPKVQLTPPPPPPSTVQKNVKKSTNDLGSTFTAKQFTSTENGLLNDVSNKPRSQVAPPRRMSTQSSVEQIPSSSLADITTTTANGQTSIPRSSSSSLSQGRKSGIPTIGKQQRPSIPTVARYVQSSKSKPFLLFLCFACVF